MLFVYLGRKVRNWEPLTIYRILKIKNLFTMKGHNFRMGLVFSYNVIYSVTTSLKKLW